VSAGRKPIPLHQDPSSWITNERETVGLLFDACDGIVATLADRRPVGTFKDWKEARSGIHEALGERQVVA
jgi:hypothetical protein